VQSGGIYINGVQVRDVEKQVTPDLFLDGKVMVIRFGKNHFKIIEGLTNEEIALEEELEQQD
jgi:tyrosyl-tRNA synthetase